MDSYYQLAELPTIFDSCFHWCSQYHKHFYRGGGGGSHEVVGKTTQQTTAKASWATFLHQYLPELLVNVYSCRVMVKVCLAVVCVEAGFCQIQSQIHM